MAEPFLAEIRIMSFGFPPKGWAFCNGQLLPINQNQALFSLLGTSYGGNGQTTFALPNLQGRAPLHAGNGHTLGEAAGEESHTVALGEMPQHKHSLQAVKTDGNSLSPNSAGLLAREVGNPYQPALLSPTTLAPEAVSTVGGSQAHLNMQPYLTLNFSIALQGIFPSPN